MEARKDDVGKIRYDLIPVEPLRRLAEVYTIGARKYSDRNWERGMQWGRIYSAMQRHANAWWGGETNDPVDGQHHLASVAWAALALMEYERIHPELDDRPTTYVHKIVFDEDAEEKAFADMFAEIDRNKFKQGTDPSDDPPRKIGEYGGV